MDAPFSFNRSVGIGSRRPDHGGFGGSDGARAAQTVSGEGAADKRDGRRIRHSQRRLARTLLLLAGQGRREHNDATALRDDPALRLATATGRARLRWARPGPDSQPTLRGGWRHGRRRRVPEVLREGSAAGGVAAEGDRVAAPSSASCRRPLPTAWCTGLRTARTDRGEIYWTDRLQRGAKPTRRTAHFDAGYPRRSPLYPRLSAAGLRTDRPGRNNAFQWKHGRCVEERGTRLAMPRTWDPRRPHLTTPHESYVIELPEPVYVAG